MTSPRLSMFKEPRRFVCCVMRSIIYWLNKGNAVWCYCNVHLLCLFEGQALETNTNHHSQGLNCLETCSTLPMFHMFHMFHTLPMFHVFPAVATTISTDPAINTAWNIWRLCSYTCPHWLEYQTLPCGVPSLYRSADPGQQIILCWNKIGKKSYKQKVTKSQVTENLKLFLAKGIALINLIQFSDSKSGPAVFPQIINLRILIF